MKAIILADSMDAGLGTSQPLALTPVATGGTILHQQIENLRPYLSLDDILVVVGYKKSLVMEAHPELLFAYNPIFDVVPSASTLLRGLRGNLSEDVLILKPGMVFVPTVVEQLLREPGSSWLVGGEASAGSDIKCVVDPSNGMLLELSRRVSGPARHTFGMLRLAARDLALVREALDYCAPGDAFERGLAAAIGRGLRIVAVESRPLFCVEVDSLGDLRRVNGFLLETHNRARAQAAQTRPATGPARRLAPEHAR